MTTISGDNYESRRSGNGAWRPNEQAAAQADQPNARKAYYDADLTAQGYTAEKTYEYTDPNGHPIYFSRRYERRGIGKKFRQGHYDAAAETEYASAGLDKVPYCWTHLIAADRSETVFWCEGEKDVDTCIERGLVATTAAGQVLSTIIAKALEGRHVVVLVDNDSKGEENAANAVEAFRHYAASLRVLRLPDLPRTEDVTYWFNNGGTVEALMRLVEATPLIGVRASPFLLQQHAEIPRREWLYKPAYIRANLSVTAGAGARGKSTLIVGEALAMASGKSFLGIAPAAPLRVWYVNLEDDMNELKRKFNAAATLHEVTPTDIADRLFVDSGCGREIVVASEDDRRRVTLNDAAINEVRATIKERRIDVVIFDPFVSLHRVSENDNGAIDLVAKALARIAQDLGCAIMLVHHTRKPNGDASGADETRGASALVNAARYVRVLNPMTKDEAERGNVDPDKRGFYFRAVDGKTNLTPPAESSEWYRLESVELGNGGDFEVEGDNVGVVTRFAFAAPPNALTNITEAQVRAALADGAWRLDRQAAQWAGNQLAMHLGMGAETKAEKDALAKAIRNALQRGWLTVFTQSVDRKSKQFVKLADLAPPAQGGTHIEGDASC